MKMKYKRLVLRLELKIILLLTSIGLIYTFENPYSPEYTVA